MLNDCAIVRCPQESPQWRERADRDHLHVALGTLVELDPGEGLCLVQQRVTAVSSDETAHQLTTVGGDRAEAVRRRDKTELLETGEDLIHALFHGLAVSLYYDFRMEWWFIGIRDAGEFFDLTSQGFLVQTLHVAGDQGVKRAFDVHLDEVADPAAHLVTDGPVRRNGCSDRYCPIAGQQMGNVADAADVGVAVLSAESQSFTQVGTHLISVEDLDLLAQGLEPGSNRVGDGRLPCS